MSILSHIVALEVGNLEKAERITELQAENLELKNDVTMIAVKARDKRIAQLEGEKDALSAKLAQAEVSFAGSSYRALEKSLVDQRLLTARLNSEIVALRAGNHADGVVLSEYVLKCANLQRDKEAYEKEIRHLNNLLASENIAHKADKEALEKNWQKAEREIERLEKALTLSKSNEWSPKASDAVRDVQRGSEATSDCIVRIVKEHGELTSDKARYASKIIHLEQAIIDAFSALQKDFS